MLKTYILNLFILPDWWRRKYFDVCIFCFRSRKKSKFLCQLATFCLQITLVSLGVSHFLSLVSIWLFTIAGSLIILTAIVSDCMETLFSDWAIVSNYMETLFSNQAIVSNPMFEWFQLLVDLWKLGFYNLNVNKQNYLAFKCSFCKNKSAFKNEKKQAKGC